MAMRCRLGVPVEQLSPFFADRNCGNGLAGPTDRGDCSTTSNETTMARVEKVKDFEIGG